MKRLGLLPLLIAFLAPLALQATVLDRSIPIVGSELGQSGVVAAEKGITFGENDLLLARTSHSKIGLKHAKRGNFRAEHTLVYVSTEIAERQSDSPEIAAPTNPLSHRSFRFGCISSSLRYLCIHHTRRSSVLRRFCQNKNLGGEKFGLEPFRDDKVRVSLLLPHKTVVFDYSNS